MVLSDDARTVRLTDPVRPGAWYLRGGLPSARCRRTIGPSTFDDGAGGVTLEIIDPAPDYGIAHPYENVNATRSCEPCEKCALAVRPDTGEMVLLWLCGGINWSISRHTPDHTRHRRDVDAGLIGLPA